MRKISLESNLMESKTPEARMDFIFNAFSAEALKAVLENHFPNKEFAGESYLQKAAALLELSIEMYCNAREEASIYSGIDHYKKLLGYSLIVAASKGKKSELNIKTKAYIDETPEKVHNYLVSMIEVAIDSLWRKLYGRQSLEGEIRPARVGDIVCEGKGFAVQVGPKLANIVTYSDGKNGIMLMHDPRDGHFLLVERYSEIDGAYVLEFPKSRMMTLHSKETAAAISLREQTGLTLRNLEKIGEIKPDTHLLDGVCDVFYGEFDLEETYTPNTKLVRDVKRINEEGLYQAAYDGMITCAQTLAAISIWRAFESVRKKRVNNSKRVRTPRKVEDD